MNAPNGGFPDQPFRPVGRMRHSNSRIMPFASLLGVYPVIAFGLYVAARGDSALLPVSLFLLAASTVGFVIAGSFALDPARQRFYGTSGILLVFTFVRVVTAGTLPSLADVGLTYGLLLVSLALYRAVAPTNPKIDMGPEHIARAIPLAVPLAVGLAAFATIVHLRVPGSSVQPVWLAALVVGIVSVFDEYWFRGVVQSSLSGISSGPQAWLGTTVLFGSFAAWSGDASLVAYHAAIGAGLGLVVWRLRALLFAMTVRGLSTGLAVLFAEILTSSIGGS